MALLLLVVIVLPPYVYADNGGQLGTKLIPGKIMENTDGVIEVYSKTDGVTINKLIATSSDPSIVQISSITLDPSHTISQIKISAIKAGDAKIALAAPGFSSTEFSLTVFKNSNIVTNLLIKATPSSFATNGPKNGYVAVESINSDGNPTPVSSDMQVSIITSDSKIVNANDAQIVIKKGSYYAIGEFTVNQPGTAQISALSSSMQIVSTSVTVNNINSQNTIQLYVYPKTINAFKAASAYAIAQLHDASGNPIIAQNDIPVTVQVTNSSGISSINTSGQNPLFQINEQMVIKKGSYWAYVPIEVTAGTHGTFNVDVSTNGNLLSSPAQLISNNTNALLDTKSARIDVLPILASGQKELIGVIHIQNPSGKILLAKDNLQIHVDSSDESVISVPDVQMERGSQAALVFAQIGSTVNPVTLKLVTDNPQSVTPTVTLPASNLKSLQADSLLPKVLTHTTFPLAFYVMKSNSLGSSTSDFNLLVSPSDSIQTGSLSMSNGKSMILTDATLLKDGMQSFSVTAPTYSSILTINGVSENAKSLTMDYPDNIIAGIKSTFSIEMLDEQQIPRYANHDITVKLVSSNPSVIEVPDAVKITKGSYFTTFDIIAKNDGTSEIAVLADEIPLSKFDIGVTSIVPEVSIQSADYGESGVPLSAEITASYKQLPLKGLTVDWKVDGAKIQSMDSITNADGKAKITLEADSPGKIHIDVAVLGGEYKLTHSVKDVTVNAPLVAGSSESTTTSQNNASTFGINPLFLFIPIVAGVGILLFKKKEMFENISTKINLLERFSELKERMTERRKN